MALVCSTTEVIYESFEFIDCSTISISYSANGLASVSFAVVTTNSDLTGDYTDMTFGEVRFTGWLNDVTISKIPGTLVNIFRLTYTAFGC